MPETWHTAARPDPVDLAGGITVFLTSAVKLLFAAPVSYALGFSWQTTVALIAMGACAGVLVFYYSSRFVVEIARRRYLAQRARRLAQGLAPKRVFTRTNRAIVQVKQRWGFWGIAAFGPPVISIPIAAVLAAKYFNHDRRTLPTMLIAVVGWALLLSSVFSFIR